MTRIDSITYGPEEATMIHMDNGASLPKPIIALLADTRRAHEETYDASMFIEAAWNAAYPVPEGVTIPARKALMEKFSDGEIHYVAQGFTTPYAVQSCDSMRCRTITPLPGPKPEPWEQSRFCYENGVIYKRLQNEYATYWVRGGDVDSYSREDLMKRNPRPVTIEGGDE